MGFRQDLFSKSLQINQSINNFNVTCRKCSQPMRAYETVISYSYKVQKQYLEDLSIIGDRKIGSRGGGEWIFLKFFYMNLDLCMHINTISWQWILRYINIFKYHPSSAVYIVLKSCHPWGLWVVSEPDPRKNQKEGLGDRLGRKYTLCPECRCPSDAWVHDCMPTRVYWKYKPQTASTVKETEKGKQDLLGREVVGAQISFYWAYGRLEVPEIMWVRTNNYKFHTFRSVHFHLSLSPRPSFRFSEGLVPRLRLWVGGRQII